MSFLQVSTGDINCRYLAAPASHIRKPQFVQHLESLGIRLPDTFSLATVVARGWISPRFRIPIPAAALQAWSNFPVNPREGTDACPPGDEWGLGVWSQATCLWPERNRPIDKLWQHWLDDPDSELGQVARANAIDPHDAMAAPPPVNHPRHRQKIQPWIDFFADWQAYHLAELLEEARFTAYVGTGQGEHFATRCRQHGDDFADRAKGTVARWQKHGVVFNWIASYRTILANCARRDVFAEDAHLGARAWAEQHNVTADQVRHGIRDTLLFLWQQWQDHPPMASNKLLLRLQQDIQYTTRLLEDLTNLPTDPFDRFWFWRNHSKDFYAQLIDALPYEEWLAQRDFPRRAVHYQRGFPHPFIHGEDQLAQRLAAFWPSCPPLRRFCLAWVRLHEELRGRDRDLPADATIAANERIEQFNLIALHTERVLRFVDYQLYPRSGQPRSSFIMLEAIRQALAVATPNTAIANQALRDLVYERTKLHDMPDPDSALCAPAEVASSSGDADLIVSAHVNALIARNYAAHHDYLDDHLIYPTRDESKRHAGGTMMSSCLLVVLAALHSAIPRQPETEQ